MKTRGTTRGGMSAFGLEVRVVFDSQHQPLSPWFQSFNDDSEGYGTILLYESQ